MALSDGARDRAWIRWLLALLFASLWQCTALREARDDAEPDAAVDAATHDTHAGDAQTTDAPSSTARDAGGADACVGGGDDGACSSSVCEPNAHSACADGHVYWFNSCDERGTLRQTCAEGCAEGVCLNCTPECSDKACGDDGCGGECGNCKGGKVCQTDQSCECEDEASSACHDGDVYWFGSCGERGKVRRKCDSGCDDDTCLNCTPDCDGKDCGDDGCGSDCGRCTGGKVCQDDQTCACVPEESSACSGDDVYWFDSCGAKGALRTACDFGCSGNKCSNCDPQCTGKNCGEDGCGDTCGVCSGGKQCQGDSNCACVSHASSACSSNDLYWFDSCGNKEGVRTACSAGCSAGVCIETVKLTLQIVGDGTISVTGKPDCSASSCMLDVTTGTELSLEATADTGMYFVSWSGCNSTTNTCDLTPSSDVVVTVIFSPANIIFVTSATYAGDFGNNAKGGLKSADDLCAAAASGKFAGTFKAWLIDSTSATYAARLGSARGFVRPDGAPVADTLTGILQGVGWYPPNLDENGNAVYGTAWTGSESSSFNNFCTGWTSTSTSGFLGRVHGSANQWSGNGTNTNCSNVQHLLCVGVDYSVKVAPAKSSGRLAFVTSGAFTPSSGLGTADTLCATEASAAGRSGTFKALLSTGGSSAASRFNLGGATWVTPEGLPIFASAGDLGSGATYRVPIAQDAAGAWIKGNPTSLWSGAPTTGSNATMNCTNWSASTAQGYSGIPGIIGPNCFAQSYTEDCSFDGRIVCLEN